MSTEQERRTIYCTPRWRALRHEVMETAGWLCEECKPRRVAATVVHHLQAIRDGGEAFNPENCVAVCTECHQQFHKSMLDYQCAARGKPKRDRDWENLVIATLAEGQQLTDEVTIDD